MHPNPYGKYIEGRDPLRSLDETAARIASMVRAWPRSKDDESYAAGKWTARQILEHLVHLEVVFTTRIRFALAQDDYRIQPFEQDDWMREEPAPPALTSLDAYLGLRSMNVALLTSLTPTQRLREASHPEWGVVTVEWLAAWCAGHELNHLPQFEAIAGRA
jgi:hypothetical protein